MDQEPTKMDQEQPPKAYSMSVPSQEIYNTTIELLNDVHVLNSEQLSEKYREYKKMFPKLYNMCLNDPDQKHIVENLNMMLSIRESTITGKKSTFESNVIVGEYVAKKYLYPTIGEPTPQKKVEALNKIIKGTNETNDPK